MNYLGQDRTDVQYAIKELSSSMSNPDMSAMIKAKRLIRYLLAVPRFVVKFRYQEKPVGITAWSDTDFAGCVKSRKSTSGGLVTHGGHVIKSWSTMQSVIALSSGEAEYYGMVKASSVAIGIRTLAGQIGKHQV